jgi:hypothetical protein
VSVDGLGAFTQAPQGGLARVRRLPDRAGQLVFVNAGTGDVDEGAHWCRDCEAPDVPDLVGLKVSVAKYDVLVLGAEVPWHSEVHAGGVELAEIVNGEGRLVRYDGATLAPEVPSDQIVVRADGPLGQPEDPAVHSLPVSVVDMELLLWV